MLNTVLGVLAAQRWFDTATPYQVSVHLTQGACLWLLLSRGAVPDTHVKFSSCLSLREEAARCAAAHASYPALAPQFVGHAQADGLELLVSRAVNFRSLDRTGLLGRAGRHQLAEDMVGYFQAMSRALPPAGSAGASHAQLIAAMAGYFGAHALAPMVQRWLATGLVDKLMTLPAMPQHGDLVLNNLGRTDGNRLVIFDWEDFGAVALPGLDLFTLELALCGDAAGVLASRAEARGPLNALVLRCCAGMQLELAAYHQLTPLYALTFRYLKRNYGPGVRDRMDQMLRDLDHRGGC